VELIRIISAAPTIAVDWGKSKANGSGIISVSVPNRDLSALSILADFLAGRLKTQNRGVAGKSLPPDYRKLQLLPVHRLDQYTSGVFCINGC